MHSKLEECTKTELDLFSVPPTQVSLEKGLWTDHQPVSSVSVGGPVIFLSPGTEDYVDLAKTILVVHAKVTKANGDGLDAGKKVGIVNNFPHSLLKQVDMFLKEKQVTQATGTYAYRAYLETLLNYGPAAKESQLTAAMFYKDAEARWTFRAINFPKRSTSTRVGSLPTPTRARSQESIGSLSTSRLLTRVRGSIPTASHQSLTGPPSRTF